jgi:hypothetical protein
MTLMCAAVLTSSHPTLQNPILPKSWWMPGKPPAEQSLKRHQVSGLRFMWNCLVVEHTAAAAAAPRKPHAAEAAAAAGDTSKGQQADGEADLSQEDDDDSDFIEDDEPAAAEGSSAQPIYVSDAGGCILAHSMGACYAGCMPAVGNGLHGIIVWSADMRLARCYTVCYYGGCSRHAVCMCMLPGLCLKLTVPAVLHHTGLGKSFQTVAMLWLFFQKQ